MPNAKNAIPDLLPSSLRVTCVRTGQTLDHGAFMARVAETAMRYDGYTDHRVILAITDPIDCLTNLFAVWGAGACAVMVNPAITASEQQRVAAKTGAALWVDDTGTKPLSPSDVRSDQLDDAALILMTSGTTGDPKGVTHSQLTLLDRLRENVAAIGADTMQNTLCTLPLFFGHGLIGNSLTPLFAGQHLYLWPQLQLHEMSTYGAMLDRLNITFLSSVPSFWRMILAVSLSPQTAPRRVHIGSAPLSQKLWADIAEWCGTDAVYNTYGMTETANWISGGTIAQSDARDGFVGAPWGGAFRVIRDGALHQIGQGEVAVRSPGQMRGLWDAPEKTAALMIDGYMRTGDIGELSADQRLWLLGRSKHEINVAGIKVLAEEIDMLLEQHPDVVEACGFGIPDDIAGERVAAVAKARDNSLTAQALQEWCRAHARSDAVPARLEIVDEIPKNDRGKIARMDVRDRMISQWQ